MTPLKRKLIEVALPLEAINREAAREKSIRHGHPSTLHLWWARRPLAAARAVLFASLVDHPADPHALPEYVAACAELPYVGLPEADTPLQRLFQFIEKLVKWENSNDPATLQTAHRLINLCTGGNPPPVLDPFAGGGTIPLEAQRLGLEAHASDLNPVAVLINKALIEIPPRFAGQPPINPEYRKKAKPSDVWTGAKGLAEDVRHYGKWMRDEAQRRIGHLYPKAKLPGGAEATVIAWLWARTVGCPNPACGCQMPLVRSWVLSSKPGKEHYVEPVISRDTQPPTVSFAVKQGKTNSGEGAIGRKGAKCIACNTPVPVDYLRSEGKAKRLGAQLLAVVAEGTRGRIYLEPTNDQVEASQKAKPKWEPDGEMPNNPRWFSPPGYGMTRFADLFTPRQLEALTTFSDLVGEARGQVLKDAEAAGLEGEKARGYSDAIAVYLAFSVDRMSEYSSTICTWANNPQMEIVRGTFARQALPMTWDYAESNVFADSTGSIEIVIDWIVKSVSLLPAEKAGRAKQMDASNLTASNQIMISTDPPYYDNIGYADLSDYFYIWMRRSLVNLVPELFGTLLVPKAAELVATPYRFDGSRQKAQAFFETGLGNAFERMRAVTPSDLPVTVYYAFKQSESEESDDTSTASSDSTASTGWETMLSGLISAGFQITGTWPIRTERSGRSIGIGTNALASSIVLVNRPRPSNAPVATRREFLQALRSELPTALRELQQGNIAPVDLAQAAIGPGMAVYSRYSRVLESDGTPMRVRTALALINQMLDEVLAEQEGDFDADTRWALAWFEQSGFAEGEFGLAETLSKAKNTSIQGLVNAGILRAKAGKVRLLRPDELPEGWNPATDTDIPVWEATHHLIRAMNSGGEEASARLLAELPNGDAARELAYRLYAICERKKWAQEGLAYNALVTSWLEVSRLAQSAGLRPTPTQEALL